MMGKRGKKRADSLITLKITPITPKTHASTIFEIFGPENFLAKFSAVTISITPISPIFST